MKSTQQIRDPLKEGNVVRNVRLFAGSNTLKYARVSLRGDRLSGKSSNWKIEKIIPEVRIEMGKMVDEVVRIRSRGGEERRLLRRRVSASALTSTLKSSIFNGRQHVDRTR